MAAAWASCAVARIGESSIVSSSGGADTAYGVGGAILTKLSELDLRAFAGGLGRRGVPVELVESIEGAAYGLTEARADGLGSAGSTAGIKAALVRDRLRELRAPQIRNEQAEEQRSL